MSNTLNYKGYSAEINFSAEDKILHGRIIGIPDLVSFEGESAIDIEAAFKVSVDDYIKMLKDLKRIR